MTILQLIASDSFITVNKKLIKEIGFKEALMFGLLASEYEYWRTHNGFTKDGYFFLTIEKAEEITTLSEYQQRKVLNHLQELGLITVKVRGLPAKRYIKVNEAATRKFLLSK